MPAVQLGKQIQLGMDAESAAFLDFALVERGRDWLRSFRRSDPSPQILRFFNDVAQGGADEVVSYFICERACTHAYTLHA